MGSLHQSENHSLLSGGGYKDERGSFAQMRRVYGEKQTLGQIQELAIEEDPNAGGRVQVINESNRVSGGVVYRDVNGNIMTQEQVRRLNRTQNGKFEGESSGMMSNGLQSNGINSGQVSGQGGMLISQNNIQYKKLSDFPNADNSTPMNNIKTITNKGTTSEYINQNNVVTQNVTTLNSQNNLHTQESISRSPNRIQKTTVHRKIERTINKKINNPEINNVNKSQTDYHNLLLSHNQPGKISGRISTNISQVTNTNKAMEGKPEQGTKGVIRNKTTSEIIYQNPGLDQRGYVGANKRQIEESVNLHPVFQNDPNSYDQKNTKRNPSPSPIINSQFVSTDQTKNITYTTSKSPNKKTIIRQNRVITKEVKIKPKTQPSPQPRRTVPLQNQTHSTGPIQPVNQVVNREIKQQTNQQYIQNQSNVIHKQMINQQYIQNQPNVIHKQQTNQQYIQNQPNVIHKQMTNQQYIQNQPNVIHARNVGNVPGQTYNNRIYQSQQVTTYPTNRFRQNSNRFENVINRSAAFTFKNGSFKTGKKNQITRIQTNSIQKKTESKSKSPNKLFNSSLQMRPRKPTTLQDSDHVEIDKFILIRNKTSGGRRFKHEIDMISDNIHRSRTPKKKGQKRVIQRSISRVKKQPEVKSRSPLPSGLPVIQKEVKSKRSIKLNKKVVKINKSNREIRFKGQVNAQTPNQQRTVITEHRKKCKFN
jgi:hypothetical protein